MILVNPCCCKKKVYVPCETYTLYIEVFGCVNPPIKPSFFAGLPISVYASPGGLLLASGVTDSTGHLTLTWPGIGPPPFWITAQSPWPDRSSSKAAWLFLSPMSKQNGVLTHKPRKMAKGQDKFERDWQEQEEKRQLKRCEAEQAKTGSDRKKAR